MTDKVYEQIIVRVDEHLALLLRCSLWVRIRRVNDPLQITFKSSQSVHDIMLHIGLLTQNELIHGDLPVPWVADKSELKEDGKHLRRQLLLSVPGGSMKEKSFPYLIHPVGLAINRPRRAADFKLLGL